MAPVRSKERIEVIDVLRGVSILGVVLMNMGDYAGCRIFRRRLLLRARHVPQPQFDYHGPGSQRVGTGRTGP